MLGRPNLLRHHCELFHLDFQVRLPKSAGDEALQGSTQYTGPEDRSLTFYGSRYKAAFEKGIGPKNSTVSVVATIEQIEPSTYRVVLHFAQEDISKPPREIASPDRLMNLIGKSALDQDVDIRAEATYVYDRADGWSVDVMEFPLPLKPQWSVVRGMPFTHIEGATFTHVVGGKTSERLSVNLAREGQIILDIGLYRSAKINQRTIRSLLRDGHRLSSGVVSREDVL